MNGPVVNMMMAFMTMTIMMKMMLNYLNSLCI